METVQRHEPRAAVVRRRLLSVPLFFGAAFLWTLLLPVTLPLALIVDVVRRVLAGKPFMATRMVAFGWFFYLVTVTVTVFYVLSWLRTSGGKDEDKLQDDAYVGQLWWAQTLFGTMRKMFRMEVVVEGDEVVEPGPLLVFLRHASLVDNLLPLGFVTGPHGIRLRYVLKHELLSLPGMDIGGNRIPNVFLDRGAGNAADLERIAQLGRDLTPDRGAIIFPEGTLFTPAKHARALEKLSSSDPALAERAARLRHLLPPRLGGPLALLDAAPGTDVLLIGHRGLAGFAYLPDIWRGAMIGTTLHIRFWRVPAAEIPADRDARVAWLYDRWQVIDDWIEETAE